MKPAIKNLPMPTNADISDRGRIIGDGKVALFNRGHDDYHGPIYVWGCRLWIFYQNRPVEVLWSGGEAGWYVERV